MPIPYPEIARIRNTNYIKPCAYVFALFAAAPGVKSQSHQCIKQAVTRQSCPVTANPGLTLLKKLNEARKALGGRVFDILGKVVFEGRPLRDLLVEAIRYGDQPDVRARLTRVVENAFNKAELQDLLEERALAHASPGAAWQTLPSQQYAGSGSTVPFPSTISSVPRSPPG